ncbi:MAG: tyrosine--tRNA ligase [Oligoflexia bacterium]|nr:tyrosine--tRNA ligase [Oligoflexia bacterium]
MDFVDHLKARGLIQDISDEAGLRKLPQGTPFYVGFDPTAPSLQLGNMVPLIAAMHLGRAGLKPIILFGGATGSIGDPGGRSSERQLQAIETTNANLERHKAQVSRIFDRAGVKAEFANNMDWTKDVSVLDFLRDVGKHFTVNYMIAKDVVKTRLDGEGISYTEFSYMLLQAFDYLHLYKTAGCRLQVGGSEQWGNITAGLELIRRKLQGEAYAISFPLIVDSQGKKFGKSEGGALWLDAERTSPYKLHQFMLNSEDSQVVKYLKIFTFLDLARISELEESLRNAPEKRECQRALADELCTLVHGAEATGDAKRCAEVLFGGSLSGLSAAQLQDIFSDAPSSALPADRLNTISVLDLFAESGLVKSKGEGKKLIASGGAYLNNERVSDAAQSISAQQLIGDVLVLRAGKKNYHLVRVTR